MCADWCFYLSADKSQPIDNVITVSCVADPLKPSAADQICYKFTSKYTIPSDFGVYAVETGGTALILYRWPRLNPWPVLRVGDNVTVHDCSAWRKGYRLILYGLRMPPSNVSWLIRQTSTTSGYYQSIIWDWRPMTMSCWRVARRMPSTYGQPTTLTVTPIVCGWKPMIMAMVPDLTSVPNCNWNKADL